MRYSLYFPSLCKTYYLDSEPGSLIPFWHSAFKWPLGYIRNVHNGNLSRLTASTDRDYATELLLAKLYMLETDWLLKHSVLPYSGILVGMGIAHENM